MFKKKWIKTLFHIATITMWFILLFLVSINFLYKINEVIIAFFTYTIGFAVLYKNKVSINLEFLVLLLFGTAYFMIYIQYMPYSPRTYVIFWLGAPAMYLAGRLFLSIKTEHLFKIVLYAIVFGLFTYGFLNMIPYFKDTSDLPDIRIAYDIWKGYWIVATLQGIYFTGMAALLFYNLIHLKLREFYLKIINLVAVGFSVYFSILLENRTFFIITVVVFVLVFIMELLLSKLKFLKPLAITTLFILALYFGYTYDLFGVQTFIVSSDWYARAMILIEQGILSDPRFPVYPLVKEQFFLYPLGGFQMDINGLDYAHNLWLDVLYAVGIYPFFILVFYTLLTGITMVQVIITKSIRKNVKILIFSLYIAYSINFLSEPILEGVPYVFLLFCLINGLTYQYLKVRRQIFNRMNLS